MKDNYHTDKEARRARRKVLCTGKCKCGKKATITWEGEKFCYLCWIAIPKGG